MSASPADEIAAELWAIRRDVQNILPLSRTRPHVFAEQKTTGPPPRPTSNESARHLRRHADETSAGHDQRAYWPPRPSRTSQGQRSLFQGS